jgi:hypothetical protein
MTSQQTRVVVNKQPHKYHTNMTKPSQKDDECGILSHIEAIKIIYTNHEQPQISCSIYSNIKIQISTSFTLAHSFDVIITLSKHI